MKTENSSIKQETAIIYCRKSTDRLGMQENTLDYQKRICLGLLKDNNLRLIKDGLIMESESAKDAGTRPGFNRMVEICNNGGVNYIIVDDAKRISRNTMDSAIITTLLEKEKIKEIITTGRRYNSYNSSDMFMLSLDFSLAKKDNKDRSDEVKRKMIQGALNGKLMGKAPFGYRNITVGSAKDVEIHPEEASLVRTVFIMRSNGDTLEAIAKYCNNHVILKKSSFVWSPDRIRLMIENKKYYGMQVYGGVEKPIITPRFEAVISKTLYEKANNLARGVEYDKSGKHLDSFYFQGLINDPSGKHLTPYFKKGHIYYHAQTIRSGYKINISQKKLFEAIAPLLKNYNFPDSIARLTKVILKEFYDDKIKIAEQHKKETRNKIEEVCVMKSSLLKKFLLDQISNEIYQTKLLEYSMEEENLKEMEASIDQGSDNVVTYIENLCELMTSLSKTYNSGDDTKKAQIIRSMQCELFIDAKKELTIKENKLFALIKSINLLSGAPDKNRTCV